MKIVKRILIVLTAAGLMLISQLSYGRHAALMIDADNGNVLYELEASQAWYPASLTKLMTLYMTFSALESGRIRLNEQLNVSSHAARQPTSKLGLRAWSTISVEDAILAVVTRSANDAAVVLAERLGGSENQFAIKMTSTAHSLGMYGSHFMNATGLPHDWQTTTAHDMALLAYKIIHNFPRYYPYFGMDSLYFNGRYLRSTNKFVHYYPGAEGMKTGYTCGSGYNLVATANLYGQRLIGVVLGGHTSYERYQQMFTMMDIGFSNESGAYRPRNINTMSPNPVGSPPYQLSCGHRPSSHHNASHFLEDDEDDHRLRHYVRKAPARKKAAIAQRVVEKPREITKIKIAGKSKTISKSVTTSTRAAKATTKNRDEKHRQVKSTKASKTEVVSKKKSGKKSVETTVTAKKTSSKADKKIQLTKANGSGKGYYVPGKTNKSSTTKSSKSKGYYNPDKASKSTSSKTVRKKKS